MIKYAIFRATGIFIILLFFSPHLTFCKNIISTVNFDSLLHKYERYVNENLEICESPGVAIAIVTDKKIIYQKGFGVQAAGQKDSVDANTVFRIASVSKGFAAILTGLLVKDGILNWDDKVKKYLPHLCLKDTAHTNNLTIRHILSHTSGLVPHAFDNLIEAKVPFEKIVKKLNEVNCSVPVGELYGYQNVVYSLISEIIEAATGETYETLLVERIFKPLGMKSASLSKAALVANKNWARPHRRRNYKWIAAKPRSTYYSVVPAAGINASVTDLAIWTQAMLGGKPQIIPNDVIDEVCKKVVYTPSERRRFNWSGNLKRAYYGLGWRIFNYAGHKMVFHSGGLFGYHAKLAFFPDHNIGIIVLQHSWAGNDFMYKFIDMYLGLDDDDMTSYGVDF